MTVLEICLGIAVIIVSVLLCIVIFDRGRTEKGHLSIPAFSGPGKGAGKNRIGTGNEKHDGVICKLFAVYGIAVVAFYLVGALGG